MTTPSLPGSKPNLLTRTLSSLKNAGLSKTAAKICKHAYHWYFTRYNQWKFYRHASVERRFTEIYKRNHWGNTESVSGDGSSLAFTANLRKHLPLLFERFGIKSILDAPCGDFNWMSHVLAEYPLNYTGADIVLPLIEGNERAFGNKNTRFVHLDLTKEAFPSSDLMICRDCLFHLSFNDTKLVLQNFVDSNIPYLLTTTIVNTGQFTNADIITGQFRPIDLFSEPFNFSTDTLFRIDDGPPPDPDREMCLWTRDQVASVIANFKV
jgi:SAM-dependent methyltransferase